MKEQSELLKKFQRKYKHHINKGLSFHTLEWIREMAGLQLTIKRPKGILNIIWTYYNI